MRKLPNRFFEETPREKERKTLKKSSFEESIFEDNDDFDYFDDEFEDDPLEEARKQQEREDKLTILKGDLCFFSFLTIVLATMIGVVVAFSRLIAYPLIKKVADSWDS